MKKLIMLLIVLAFALNIAALAEDGGLLGQTMPDFSVTDTDGREITLSGLLAEKDVVVLNIFASWCPPCRMEFPDMESTYQALSDRMEIVALSGDPDDTSEMIADYKVELGLSFPMGLAEGTGILDFVDVEGYPTTLLIDKSGQIGFFQLGAFMSEQQFRDAVEHFMADGYDGNPVVSFNVYVCDQDENPVPGVALNFCTDTVCQFYTSDENGIITFVGAPERYHLQILSAPEGYSYDADLEQECDGSDWAIVQLQAE